MKELVVSAPTWEGATADALAARWDAPRVHLYASVGSTNDVARELAGAGAPAGTIVLAEEQLSGRGRAGKAWHSRAGMGVWMSIVLRPAELTSPGIVPLLVGARAAEAIESRLPGIRIGIKWPNDLFIGERKVGGILCESVWEGERPAFVVAGVGLNVLHREEDLPGALRTSATSLRIETGRPPERGRIAGGVAGALASLTRSIPAELPEQDRSALETRDTLRGSPVFVTVSEGREAGGIALGIDGRGRLLLRDEHGAIKRVGSGSVRRAPAAAEPA